VHGMASILLDSIARRSSRDIVSITLVAGAQALATALSTKADEPALTTLDVSHNALLPEGVAPLVQAIATCGRLQHLKLGHNGIRDEGFQVVAGLVGSDECSLNTLDLSHNMGTMIGLTHLARALGSNNRLVQVNVRGNDWGDEAGTVLAQHLRSGFNFELQHLVRVWYGYVCGVSNLR